MRLRTLIFCTFVFFFFLLARSSAAQSPTGTISGIVTDPSGAAIAGAEILVENDATRVQVSGKTNEEGIYVIPNLPPGSYRVQVSKVGFKTIIKPDIVLNVQDALAINFALPLGAVSEIVTIQGGAPLVNTESAAVSTVIDRQFVENLPLNGRSFNTLLQLTPGVVIAPTTGAVATGQFSIAGQRTDANNFSVDGVSANFGVTAGLVPGQSGTGTSQAFSALGGTSSLVSVEALQEFRIVTSSFAPEFGRSPGGQVVLTTRSGTNDLHGGTYEYFRNDVLDANDWFANAAGQSRAPERHNDFGAFLGGPIWKDRTFFFMSYEGARLRLPQTSVFAVPSNSIRQSAPSSLAPFLDSYPVPNGPASADGYTAQFTGVYSNSATLNAGSFRIDHKFNDRFSVFGRYNEAPSETGSRVFGLSTLETISADTRTVTGGVNMVFSSAVGNFVRANYSRQHSAVTDRLTPFDGSIPINPSFFIGSLPSSESLVQFQTGDTNFLSNGALASGLTQQFNVADDVNVIKGSHAIKTGADYRMIFLNLAPSAQTFFFTADTIQSLVSTGTGDLSVMTRNTSRLLTQTFSLYAQDTWKATARLTLTYGVRWELSPAPTGRGATQLASWTNTNNPSQFALAPLGTPLWQTTYGNVAPRLGVAYALTEARDFVIRASVGTFYDLGVGQAATLGTQFPNAASLFSASVPVPISDATPYLPTNSLQPPYPGAYGFSPNLELPRSYQWNVALEKSLQSNQVVTATYVGQAGRKLQRNAGYFQPNPSFSSFFYLTTNGAFSNYHALQLQYKKLVSSRLQAIANYTFSHSLDNSSNDVISGANAISAAGDYASSDFDVRQSFSTAVHYELPAIGKSGAPTVLSRNWSLDLVGVARSGFPFNGRMFVVSPVLGFAYMRPDLVAGQPIWIAGPSAPGGKSLNPLAFAMPPAGTQGTEGRNDIRGFGLTQFDLSIARKFALTDRVHLQFRADAFNVLNHPNFTNPQGFVFFGGTQLRSNRMLNQALGGLNPLFQEGGPRSFQLSLRLTF
ncbi:MAG TPA: TonB-dependent receptor [Candidatus Acidoferrum sp.]|nr:TonB-dependent receptor [Candidatus Acidoferrum sp.]